MQLCYEGLKEIRVNVDEIYRKSLGFRVSIVLLPLILIVLWDKTLLWRFERNWYRCQWDMKKNVFIWSIIHLDPLLFLLDRSSCVFLGWGVGVVGIRRYLDPSPAPYLYITNHFTSLTSFKTMFNIVYELASFKTIICSRGGWW